MRIHILVLPVLAVVCMSFAACGSGKNSGTPSAAGSPTPAKTASVEAFKAAAERAANSTLLTIIDFSKGWSGAAPHHSDLGLQLSPDCQAWSNKPSNYDGSVFENESDEFSAKNDESVSSDVGVYRTKALAEQGQGLEMDMFTRCRGEAETAFKQYFADTPGIIAADAKFVDVPATAKGDWSYAFKLAINVQGETRTVQSDLYVNIVRSGRVIASVSYSDDGTFDPQMAGQLVTTLSDRVAAANAALPE